MSSKFASPKFWIDTADRAVSTTAQAALAAGVAGASGILAVDWLQVLAVAGLAGAASVLQSIAARGRGDESDPPGSLTA